jgi:transcriptional regulator with XRE-family HTH domain
MTQTTESRPERDEHTPDMAPFHTGRLVAAVREARGWTRPQLAKALGWTTRRLTEVEEGRKPLPPDKVAAVAETLGFGPWALAFTEDFLRNDGHVALAPGEPRTQMSWKMFTLGLEAGRMMAEFIRFLARANPPGGRPEARA